MTHPGITVYSTMDQRKVPLAPVTPGKIGIYVCGPTVYGHIHIGNARTLTSFDTVVRYLRYRGFGVRYVRNYTDVDDKIIRGAKVVGDWLDGGKEVLSIGIDGSARLRGEVGSFYIDGQTLHAGAEEFAITDRGLSLGARDLDRRGPPVSPLQFAQYYIEQFERDAAALRLMAPDVSPKVSETIPEIIALVEKLISRGAAYPSQGDVYFEVRKYPGYLRLSHRSLDEEKAGARVEPGEQKRDPLDFALWKAAKPGEVAWESPWGQGRPGWHIECSAMSAKYLGERFDLHGGGMDLIFPHHENEIAQSEAASGTTMCSCWMHAGLLDIRGAKMSKSLGNVLRLCDALQQVDGEALRYFFLSTHYRQALDFSEKSLADAEARLEYFYETLHKVDERLAKASVTPGPMQGDPGKLLAEFDAVVSDDFNFAGGFGVLSALFADLNLLTDSKSPVKDKAVANRTLRALREVATKLASVLGLFEEEPAAWLSRRRDRLVKARGIDKEKVEQNIAARTQARKAKDFAEADRIRRELLSWGVEIMDTPNGTTWKVAERAGTPG